MSGERRIVKSAQPQSIGLLLDTTFRQYRNYFRYWFLAAACILLPWLILNAFFEPRLETNLTQFFQSQLQSAMSASKTPSTFNWSTVGSIVPSIQWVLMLLHVFIVGPLLYGIILHHTTELNLFNATVTVDKSFSKTIRRLWQIAVTNLLYWVLLALLSFLVLFGSLFLISWMTVSHSNIVLTVIVVVLVIALMVLFVWLGVRFSFIGTVTLEEDRIAFSSMARSWVLTRGNFWRTLGFLVIISFIVEMLQSGVAFAVGLLFPGTVFGAIIIGIISLFATPLVFLGRANLYTDVRIRTDSPDLHRWLNPEQRG